MNNRSSAEDFLDKKNNPFKAITAEQIKMLTVDQEDCLARIEELIYKFNGYPYLRLRKVSEQKNEIKRKKDALLKAKSDEQLKNVTSEISHDLNLLKTEMHLYYAQVNYAETLKKNFPSERGIQKKRQIAIENLIQELNKSKNNLHLAKNLYLQVNLYLEKYAREEDSAYLEKLISTKEKLQQLYKEKLSLSPSEAKLFNWLWEVKAYNTWDIIRINLKDAYLKTDYQELVSAEQKLSEFDLANKITKQTPKSVFDEKLHLEERAAELRARYQCKRAFYIQYFSQEDAVLLRYPEKPAFKPVKLTDQQQYGSNIQLIKFHLDLLNAAERAYQQHEKYIFVRSDDLVIMCVYLEKMFVYLKQLKASITPNYLVRTFANTKKHLLSEAVENFEKILINEKKLLAYSWLARINNHALYGHDYVLKTLHDMRVNYFHEKRILDTELKLLQKPALVIDPKNPDYSEDAMLFSKEYLEDQYPKLSKIKIIDFANDYIKKNLSRAEKSSSEDILSEPNYIETIITDLIPVPYVPSPEVADDAPLRPTSPSNEVDQFEIIRMFLEQLTTISNIHSEEGKDQLAKLTYAIHLHENSLIKDLIATLTQIITGKLLPSRAEKSRLIALLDNINHDSAFKIDAIYTTLLQMYVLRYWKYNTHLNQLEDFFANELPWDLENWRKQFLDYKNLIMPVAEHLFDHTIKFKNNEVLSLSEPISEQDAFNLIQLSNEEQFNQYLARANFYIEHVYDGHDHHYLGIFHALKNRAKHPDSIHASQQLLEQYELKYFKFLLSQTEINYTEWLATLSILSINPIYIELIQEALQLKISDADFRKNNFRHLFLLINKFGNPTQKALIFYFKIERYLTPEFYNPNLIADVDLSLLQNSLVYTNLLDFLTQKAKVLLTSHPEHSNDVAFLIKAFPVLFRLANQLNEPEIKNLFFSVLIKLTVNCQNLGQLQIFLNLIQNASPEQKNELCEHLNTPAATHLLVGTHRSWNGATQAMAVQLGDQRVSQKWFTQNILELLTTCEPPQYTNEIDQHISDENLKALYANPLDDIPYAKLSAACGMGVFLIADKIENVLTIALRQGDDIKQCYAFIKPFFSADFLEQSPRCALLKYLVEKLITISDLIKNNLFTEAHAQIINLIRTYQNQPAELTYINNSLHFYLINQLRFLTPTNEKEINQVALLLCELPHLKNQEPAIKNLVALSLNGKEIQSQFFNFCENLNEYLKSEALSHLYLSKDEFELFMMGLTRTEINLLVKSIDQILNKAHPAMERLALPYLVTLRQALLSRFDAHFDPKIFNVAQVFKIIYDEYFTSSARYQLQTLLTQLPEDYYSEMQTNWRALISDLIHKNLFDAAETLIGSKYLFPKTLDDLKTLIESAKQFHLLTNLLAKQNLKDDSWLAAPGFNANVIRDNYAKMPSTQQTEFKNVLESIVDRCKSDYINPSAMQNLKQLFEIAGMDNAFSLTPTVNLDAQRPLARLS